MNGISEAPELNQDARNGWMHLESSISQGQLNTIRCTVRVVLLCLHRVREHLSRTSLKV